MPIPSRPIADLARDVNLRGLEQLFATAHFPCDRKQLVGYARDHFASADLLAVLDSVPERVYHNVDDVSRAVQALGSTSAA